MQRSKLGSTFVLCQFILAIAPTPSVAEAPDAHPRRLAIVERSIEFHGGEVFSHSQSDLQVCSRSGCFELVARVEGGSFDLEAAGAVREHHRRVRITNDTIDYWQDDEVQQVAADRAESLRNWVMARVYFVFLPFRLQDPSVIQQDLGSEIWDGRALRKVKVSFISKTSNGADDEFLYWFDPATARLEQFAYSFAGRPGGLRFRRLYDFRRVGGILFYDQENWGVDEDGLSVDDIRPAAVAEWNRISTVNLREIEVRPLDP